MRIVFAQIHKKDNPFHEKTLEGTRESPLYLCGYVDEYKGLNPIRIETNNCQEIPGIIFSSVSFALSNKVASILIQPEEDGGDSVLFRECRFVREELIEVKRASETSTPEEIGADPYFDIAVFDMYFEVIS